MTLEVKLPIYEDICKIFLNEDIYACISDDNCPKIEDAMPVMDQIIKDNDFVGIYLDGKVIGILQVGLEGSSPDLHIHYQMLKEYRKEHASEGLKMCLKLLKRPLFCLIPTYYKNVSDFAENHGFKFLCSVPDKTLIKGKEYSINKYILQK